MSPDDAARDLYRRVIDGWNAGDAEAMTAPMAADVLMIGFDGSQVVGRDQIAAELGGICADHETARYVTKARRVGLSESVALFQTTPAQLHGREELSEALTGQD